MHPIMPVTLIESKRVCSFHILRSVHEHDVLLFGQFSKLRHNGFLQIKFGIDLIVLCLLLFGKHSKLLEIVVPDASNFIFLK
jgi:hypothetical protein